MLAIVFGLIFMVLGLWGLVSWWADFLTILKGMLPVLFFFGGLLAVIAGATSIHDAMETRTGIEKETEKKEE